MDTQHNLETPHTPEPAPSPPEDDSSFPGAAPMPRRRPRGKVARLPGPLRDQLNKLIDDGLKYSDVIAQLGPDAAHLTEVDLSRWYRTGHQDWLTYQRWIDQTRARLDLAVDVIAENDGANVHLANLHVAATQLIETLVRTGETLLAEHPDQYVSLINAISRLGHEALNYHKYREACTMARAELAKFKDPNRKLSDAETLAIVDKLDHILGFK
jgi:hypothetical protein